MKVFFLVATLCLTAAGSARAQAVKLFGYVQKVVAGNTAGRELREDGTQSRSVGQPGEDYFLYLAAPAHTRVYFVEGWLKGQRIGLRAQAVASPVVMDGLLPAQESTELVPKQPGTVWRLTTTAASAAKTAAKSRALSTSNDVVVVYRMKGKLGYATLAKLADLPAAYRQ